MKLAIAVLAVALAGCSTAVSASHHMTGEATPRKQESPSPSTLASACTLTMTQAIDAALKKVDGKALNAAIEIEKGKAVYEVKVFSNGKLYEVEIDAATGAVLEVEQEGDEDDGDGDDD